LSRLELAAGGTLFLDAVHELPAEFQHALIELLEHRPSRHTGTEPETDTRVIASTPHDLTTHGQGRLLEPLLRILARNRIKVPALADRREDIPLLADYSVPR